MTHVSIHFCIFDQSFLADSFSLQYNLYYDKLLNGDQDQQFPQFVYDMQDKFYLTIAREFCRRQCVCDTSNSRRPLQ